MASFLVSTAVYLLRFFVLKTFEKNPNDDDLVKREKERESAANRQRRWMTRWFPHTQRIGVFLLRLPFYNLLFPFLNTICLQFLNNSFLVFPVPFHPEMGLGARVSSDLVKEMKRRCYHFLLKRT